MKRLRISKGGQVSIPAEVRHRWDTHTVIAEDEGDRLVLRPVPDDPIAAARGWLRDLTMTSDEMREQARREEQEIERRKYGAR
jgi:bifunctional DNA-binding transcriptional regulator/antitoxin component of YhaV-PrlF toxin-antitoxin module